MKKLFVRIAPKTGPETFYRCGMQFARAWTAVEVDKATAERLHAEQMLEVSEDQPEDFGQAPKTPAEAPAETGSGDGEGEGEGEANAVTKAVAKAAAQAKKK